MDQSREYTAENGLDILHYLGITNITAKEEAVFREKWDEFYRGHNKDFIGTIWVLYAEALSFICGDGDRGSFMVAQLRDSDFGQRIKKTKLDKELKEGISLEDILKKGPHIFYYTIKLDES